MPNLQQTITHCCSQWNIKVSKPFPDLSYNYVAPARTGDGVSCVLKINKYPDFYREIAALHHYAGVRNAQIVRRLRRFPQIKERICGNLRNLRINR